MDDRVYVTALFIHVVGVALLFSASALELFQVAWLRRSTTVGEVQMAERIESVLKRLVPVAIATIVASGLFMLIKGWSWSAHWAEVAIISLLLASIPAAIFTKKVQEILQAADEAPPGPLSDSLRARTMDPVLLTSVCVLVAMGVGILYVMAIKPETVEAIVAVLVAMALAAAGAWLGDMRAKRRVPQQVSARTPVDVEL
jgi:hypothetical protein